MYNTPTPVLTTAPRPSCAPTIDLDFKILKLSRTPDPKVRQARPSDVDPLPGQLIHSWHSYLSIRRRHIDFCAFSSFSPSSLSSSMSFHSYSSTSSSSSSSSLLFSFSSSFPSFPLPPPLPLPLHLPPPPPSSSSSSIPISISTSTISTFISTSTSPLPPLHLTSLSSAPLHFLHFPLHLHQSAIALCLIRGWRNLRTRARHSAPRPTGRVYCMTGRHAMRYNGMSLPILLHVTTSANQLGITIITIATHVGITRVTVINSVYLSFCLPQHVTEVGRKSKSGYTF